MVNAWGSLPLDHCTGAPRLYVCPLQLAELLEKTGYIGAVILAAPNPEPDSQNFKLSGALTHDGKPYNGPEMLTIPT